MDTAPLQWLIRIIRQRLFGDCDTLPIPYRLRNKQGFTILEIMIALSISVLIISVLFQWYRMQWNSMAAQNNLIAVIEQAHLVSDYLASEIEQAGYVGCVKVTDNFPVTSDLSEMIPLHPWLIIAPHMLTVRHANKRYNELYIAMHDFNQLIISNTVRFKTGDIVVVSDCKQAEIFKIHHVYYSTHHQVIIPEQPLHHLFSQYSVISLFESNYFFVDNGYLTASNIYHRKSHLVKGVREITFHLMLDHTQARLIEMKLKVFDNAMERLWYVSMPYP